MSRRAFLSAAAVSGAFGVSAGSGLTGLLDVESEAAAPLPAPERSGIDHIVVVMMENRSFDHFLGWVPGADGRQSGLRYRDRHGRAHRVFHQRHLSGCGFADPSHSYRGGRIEYDHGKCDGWLRANPHDLMSISYYKQGDLPFLGHAAPYWTTCDRYFAAVMAPTYPNRMYQHAARADRLRNSTHRSHVPTIWDRLAAKGVRGKYYYSDIPFLALWGRKHRSIAAPFRHFLTDAAAGRLPSVSFVDPRFAGEARGVSGDDHPPGDIRTGEAFLSKVYSAVTNSPNWPNTLLVINFDEWGGFYDHVPPRRAHDAHPQTALRGFRVPALVISPRARRHHVNHTVFDHTSILRAIEWRWNLDPLTTRDAHAHNIARALDFGRRPDLTAPRFKVAPFHPRGCRAPTRQRDVDWTGLRESAEKLGWP